MIPKRKTIQQLGLIALSFAGFSAHSAKAATDTWSGATNGTWDTGTSNWLDDGTDTLFNSGNDALFTGTPTTDVTAAGGLTIGAINLDGTFTGTVAMTGVNTVSGATTVSGGTIRLTNTGGLGSSAVTVNSGGKLWFNFGTGTNTNAISGDGLIELTPGTDTSILSGNLSGFTGTLSVLSGGTTWGKLAFGNVQGNQLSSGATIQVQNGATVYLNNALNYGAKIELFGAGGPEPLGALRIENGNQTGAVTLKGNTTIGTNSGTGTISGNIGQSGGSFGFSKVGGGTLVLSGNNTYSGGTTISAGTLTVKHSNALGTGAVALSGGQIAFDASASALTVNNNISGNTGGNWNLTPTNKITLGGTNNLTIANNFGGLLINAGAGGVDITGSTTITGAAGNQQSGYMNVMGNVTIAVQTGGSLAVNGTTNASKPGGIVGQNTTGTSTLWVNGGSLTIGGNTGFALGNNRSDASGVLTVSSGTATITAGSTTLQDQLNYIAMGRDAATGIINLDGGTLATGRQFVRDGSSGGTAGSGTATFNFNGGTLQAQADQTSGNGWFETAATGNFQVVTTTVKAGGAKIDTNGFNTNINTVLAHDISLGGTADGGLTKSGSGTLSLGAANTYTGATVVSAGMLALGVNGTIGDTIVLGTASPTVGTLDVTAKSSFSVTNVSGNGTINIGTGKTVTVTGSLAPGFSPGTLDVTGDLALAASTSTTLELAGIGGVAGTDSDYVNATGSLTLDGLLAIVSYGGYDLTQNASYNLFDAASFTGDFDGVSVGGNALSFASDVWSGTFSGTTYSFSETTGVLTVVPEPAAALLGGLAMLTLLRRRRP